MPFSEIIVAMDKNGGIGYQGKIPWKCREELKLFSEKTKNATLIVGRKTFETLPELKGRNFICLTRKQSFSEAKNNCIILSNLEDAFNQSNELTFIAGGSQIYDLVLSSYPHRISGFHLSIMKKEYLCDSFIHIPKEWNIVEKNDFSEFDHYVLRYHPMGENLYLRVLENVLNTGKLKKTRNGNTLSVFNQNLKFNLQEGFPLLTTKKMFFRGIVEELIFFLEGETNTKKLEEKGIKIWEKNTTKEFLENNNLEYKEGLMGPMYGYQWRYFNAEYDPETGTHTQLSFGKDQIELCIQKIINTPNARDIMLTTFNPAQVNKGVLPPCHSIVIQFHTEDKYLDMFVYNRSSDLFLGLPFNIASSALFLTLFAKATKRTARFMYMTLGDAHIYENHIDAVKTQIQRFPYDFPQVEINFSGENDLLWNLKAEQFVLKNYQFHESIKAEMNA